MKPWSPQPGDRVLPGQGVLPFTRLAGFVPRARRTDPLTSHEAAARVPEFGDDHRDRIVAALREHGPGTCWDIAGWTGLDHVRVARRMKELEELKPARVVRTSSKRPGPTGTGCTVWAAVSVTAGGN
jgi:hypothetical protein